MTTQNYHQQIDRRPLTAEKKPSLKTSSEGFFDVSFALARLVAKPSRGES
jgi:hypothetical protein